MSDALEGKTVIITGAASGQGRAGAILFARAGANLALCDIDDAGLEETAKLVAGEAAVKVRGADKTQLVGIEADLGLDDQTAPESLPVVAAVDRAVAASEEFLHHLEVGEFVAG